MLLEPPALLPLPCADVPSRPAPLPAPPLFCICSKISASFRISRKTELIALVSAKRSEREVERYKGGCRTSLLSSSSSSTLIVDDNIALSLPRNGASAELDVEEEAAVEEEPAAEGDLELLVVAVYALDRGGDSRINIIDESFP